MRTIRVGGNQGRGDPKTGWPAPKLAQDDDRKLFRWFASKPDARHRVREACDGMVTANGGRFVDTHRHEAPRPVPITLADDGGVLTQEGAAVLAGRVLWALRAVFVLAGAGLLVLALHLAQ